MMRKTLRSKMHVKRLRCAEGRTDFCQVLSADQLILRLPGQSPEEASQPRWPCCPVFLHNRVRGIVRLAPTATASGLG